MVGFTGRCVQGVQGVKASTSGLNSRIDAE